MKVFIKILRWILLLPVSLLASGIAKYAYVEIMLILHKIYHFLGNTEDFGVFFSISIGFVSGMAYIITGAYISPSQKDIVIIILGIVYLIISGIVIFTIGFDISTITSSIVILILTVLMSLSYFEEMKNKVKN